MTWALILDFEFGTSDTSWLLPSLMVLGVSSVLTFWDDTVLFARVLCGSHNDAPSVLQHELFLALLCLSSVLEPSKCF